MGHRKWKEKLPVNYENYIKEESHRAIITKEWFEFNICSECYSPNKKACINMKGCNLWNDLPKLY